MLDTTSSRLSRRDASAYLLQRHGISRTVSTLAKLAVVGGGPRFRKVGLRQVVYDASDLDAWVTSILSEPLYSTSERAA